MKNKITDLRDHMFAALERLSDESLSMEELELEIKRSQTVSNVGKVIVESAKTQLSYAKLTGRGDEETTKFLEAASEPPAMPKIERPESKYSNGSPLGIAKEA